MLRARADEKSVREYERHLAKFSLFRHDVRQNFAVTKPGTLGLDVLYLYALQFSVFQKIMEVFRQYYRRLFRSYIGA